MDSQKIRILLVVRWPVGGIRTFLKYVISAFPEKKCIFHIIATENEGMDSLKDEMGNLINSWVFVQEGKGATKSLLFASYRYLKSNQIDIIHAHGFSSVVASVIPAKLLGKPLIFTSHDVLQSNQFKGFRGFLKRVIVGLSLAQCEVIQSVSQGAETNLLSYFPWARKRCVVIRSGINTRHFISARPQDLKAMIGLNKETILIGFFGRFMGPKGFRFLIDALRIIHEEFNDTRFHVVCFGSGAYIREEKAEIARVGLDRYFTFSPFISDVSRAMKGCDLIVMPSRWEACGLVAMEALVSGVPFVGSDCIGLREVMEGTPAVIVKTSDSHSLAQGILSCSRIDRALFEKFSEEAAERFDVISTASSIYYMYERIVK